ncbi:hypothetical protein Aduo_012252 [Ancylostoma duodenale]
MFTSIIPVIPIRLQLSSTDLQLLSQKNGHKQTICVDVPLYPKPLKNRLGKDGAKIFFYHAILASTSQFSPIKKEVVDYKWVMREEFWSTVSRKKYKACVNSVFLE